MRTLKWDPLFDPEEETTTAIAWISFPSLPPNFFGKETIISMVAAVGRPLQVDMATQNKTRSSCARVKVEVGLLGECLKRINIGMRKNTGEVIKKMGHNEKECYVLHPKLFTQMEQAEEGEKLQVNKEDKAASGRRIGNRRGYHNQRRKPEQVWTQRVQERKRVEVDTKNQFGALEDTISGQEDNNEVERVDKQETHIRKEVEDKVEGRGAETVKIRCHRENNDKSSEQNTNITANEELVQQESARNSGRVVEKILTKEKAVVSIGEQAVDFFNSNIDQQMPEELQDK
ncbi:hypothetical protein H5410_050866 [Solanum commersonii]|uniref:DUF4283 domain-containing protein n=1 Tax=Solanum commersonii TaxID=4109 RepID=A0A9J5WY03_SOLCO|nr:hypothetical protein H5410_050866 [Solanum commersonii]